MRALIDTSSLLALSRARDQYHAEAVELARAHIRAGGRFIGTTLILGEFYAHLLYLRGPQDARRTLADLLNDPVHEWVDVSSELVREALERWLSRFSDQSFSLVDAVSFEVMRREKVTQAFAFDRHFETAGFAVLRT